MRFIRAEERRMKRETRIAILKDIYQESAGISDADLYDEAITTLENYFAIIPGYLYYRSRVEAIAYLALINERERSIPVRHGRWIFIRDEGGGNSLYSCSECGQGDIQSPEVVVPYCWHCGAKMDADRSEE